MTMSENESNDPTNEPISREQFARLWGGASAVFGVIVLFLSWVIPHSVADKVAACNTVAGDLYARSHAGAGFGCAAANFVTDFRWVGLLVGGVLLIGGLIVFFGANDPEIRENFGLD